MGRGLSHLQRIALEHALANRTRERRTGYERAGADVYHYEILAAAYGWEPTHAPLRAESGAEHRTPLAWHFSPSAIGRAVYEAATTATTRALRRLEERGLVTRRAGREGPRSWSGADLTPAGAALAAQLLRGLPNE